MHKYERRWAVRDPDVPEILPMRILVVEDERHLASFIKRGLEEQTYAVDVAYDGEKAEYMARTNDYDLILLDLLLPKQDGWQTCRHLRQAGLDIPIIILTALGEVPNRVRGLDDGADDYITKPFAFDELLARIRASMRRAHSSGQPVIVLGDIELDTVTRTVKRGGNEIQLTNKEFALLEYLILHKNTVVTRTMIAEHVWDIHFDAGSNVIDVFVNYLRKKIDVKGAPRLIRTVRGIGYMVSDGTST